MGFFIINRNVITSTSIYNFIITNYIALHPRIITLFMDGNFGLIPTFINNTLTTPPFQRKGFYRYTSISFTFTKILVDATIFHTITSFLGYIFELSSSSTSCTSLDWCTSCIPTVVDFSNNLKWKQIFKSEGPWLESSRIHAVQWFSWLVHLPGFESPITPSTLQWQWLFT